jgi:hypothetical protein
MNANEIKIGGRVLTLIYNMDAVLRACDDDGKLPKLGELASTPGGRLKLLAACANAGELAAGRKADITVEWLARHMWPSRLELVQLKLQNAYIDGMRMETEDDEAGEVDVVLEELKKKLPPEVLQSASSSTTDSPADSDTAN